MADIEKVIKGLESCKHPFCQTADCPYAPWDRDLTCKDELFDDALELLKEQEAEIAFLKAMQLQTVHNMSNEDIGNAVRNVLRL